ncbi:hypothetical protein AMJ40_01340 [candidate division TA06 bacterium DG_26]|uniref:Tryptophan--tRNA ligase n=1 Tax=candidate division TA06 bacterium DG_26 TaxID=1703771 RepID=A0A0S7WLJ6_UNCT6|nr:MAG: hypothetical protein AMJ40_01340 [candidate division TA06 bacterium DG_26]
MARDKVFSGVQPTGELHIGNLFGAIRNWVELQEKYSCFYCIVDYHAMTTDFDPNSLRSDGVTLAMDLIACGIDPSRCTLFLQSDVPEHTELAWILSCFTSYGDLARMTQFKEKSKNAGFVNAGLFNYPVLQAADILLYMAGWVPVGEDQLQHLELARRIARRFNSQVREEFFPEVNPILSKAPRIMSLSDPSQKMSKSLGPDHYVGIAEPDDMIWKKIKTAVTDKGLEETTEMSPGVENLFTILKNTAEPSLVQTFAEKHRGGTLLYAELKKVVFENLRDVLGPIRERRNALRAEEVSAALTQGGKRASRVARRTIRKVRKLVGVGAGEA